MGAEAEVEHLVCNLHFDAIGIRHFWSISLEASLKRACRWLPRYSYRLHV
jgi:hypothetical protein